MPYEFATIWSGTILAIITSVGSMSTSASAAAFDKIVVFGDSLSDVGNDYIATKKAEPAPPYYEGRFSNGPIWIENIAATYAITLKPSLSGGTDYAYGGSETIADTSSSYGTIPSLYTQAKTYLKSVGGKADPKALYVIWGGSNDLLDTVETNPSDLPSLPARFAKVTVQIANLLRLAGAKSFLVPQVPDIGRSPLGEAYGSIVAAAASDASKAMNAALAVALLEPELSTLKIYHLQDYTLQDDLIGAATAGAARPYFNLANVAKPCLTGKTVCANEYRYFFWDDLHPTTLVHAMLATGALAVLPH